MTDWNAEAAKFKFAVGDVLVHRAEPKGLRFVVVAVTLEQCHGGVQRHYVVKTIGYTRFGGGSEIGNPSFIMNEAELSLAPAPAEEPKK